MDPMPHNFVNYVVVHVLALNIYRDYFFQFFLSLLIHSFCPILVTVVQKKPMWAMIKFMACRAFIQHGMCSQVHSVIGSIRIIM